MIHELYINAFLLYQFGDVRFLEIEQAVVPKDSDQGPPHINPQPTGRKYHHGLWAEG